MRWVGGLAAVVVTTVLAGCSGGGGGGAHASPFDDIPEPTKGHGSIAGVVVDEVIRPIKDATVSLVSPAINTTTDANGEFVFRDLAPGTYFVRAEARRHHGVQSSIDVVADEITATRMLLLSDPSPEPYHTIYNFHGHVDTYLGFAQFAVEVVAPGTLPCTCAWNITADMPPETIVFEADGTVTIANPGTPATDDGDAYWELIGNGGAGEIKNAYEDFPFSHVFANGSFQEPGTSYLARITGGVWPSGNMDYDLFVTFWYRAPAPDGWSILNGDT